MTAIVLIAAAFDSVELAEMARARMRPLQARAAGRLRLLPGGEPRREDQRVILAGPIWSSDLDTARRMVDELGGRLRIVTG